MRSNIFCQKYHVFHSRIRKNDRVTVVFCLCSQEYSQMPTIKYHINKVDVCVNKVDVRKFACFHDRCDVIWVLFRLLVVDISAYVNQGLTVRTARITSMNALCINRVTRLGWSRARMRSITTRASVILVTQVREMVGNIMWNWKRGRLYRRRQLHAQWLKFLFSYSRNKWEWNLESKTEVPIYYNGEWLQISKSQ